MNNALPKIATANQQLSVAAAANQQIAAGNNVEANVKRVNAANNKAANNFMAGAATLNSSANRIVNAPNSFKNKLRKAASFFEQAAMHALTNKPLNAARSAGNGIRNLPTVQH